MVHVEHHVAYAVERFSSVADTGGLLSDEMSHDRERGPVVKNTNDAKKKDLMRFKGRRDAVFVFDEGV